MKNHQEEKNLQLPTESWSKPEVLVLDIKEETLGNVSAGADGTNLS